MNPVPLAFKIIVMGQIMGIIGLILVITGIAQWSIPAALITAGIALLVWSALVAAAAAKITKDPR